MILYDASGSSKFHNDTPTSAVNRKDGKYRKFIDNIEFSFFLNRLHVHTKTIPVRIKIKNCTYLPNKDTDAFCMLTFIRRDKRPGVDPAGGD